ncbi:hypothetical protein OKW76_00360 [Sphingomonas sp. S1-29]|uniref:hypothetical protein n=1 Tax=Sphingomonas sp. S1-29 TaxID=2991074 RepID=UPI00223F1F57|nr:hypothetical protein [Sphingomonas sp. S1-29]UZK69577.1 hypothetical protein OKW76_00360 [Sphingomonas sp. S1-29]
MILDEENMEIDSTKEHLARINELERDLVRFSTRCLKLEKEVSESLPETMKRLRRIKELEGEVLAANRRFFDLEKVVGRQAKEIARLKAKIEKGVK